MGDRETDTLCRSGALRGRAVHRRQHRVRGGEARAEREGTLLELVTIVRRGVTYTCPSRPARL